MRLFSAVIISIVMTFVSTARAQILEGRPPNIQEETARLFESGKDLLDIKLTVDSIVDPSTNPAAVKTMIEKMVNDIRALSGETANSKTKLAALRRYLYESGPWNNGNPFRYDLDDPLGQKSSSRLLQRYMTTRRGNCITMPMLMIFLGQRLGLNMRLAEAPLHLFVKYTDDEGIAWNLEATSGGGFTRNIWYRQKLPMTDLAVTNGVYLRPLSHEQSVAVIASLFVETHIKAGRFEEAIEVADVILQHYPNFTYGLVKKGNAYSGLLKREIAGRYATANDMPRELKQQADEWYRQNSLAFSKAEALGWTPDDRNEN